MQELSAEKAYRGHTVDVSHKRFRRADGTEVDRQVIEHPGSVAILAHDEEFVYLTRQPREAVAADGLLEIPAGTRDREGETELECAQRELAEEIGMRAERWSLLQVIYTSPGVLEEAVTIFEATELSPAAAEPDEDEQIEVVRLALGEVEAALPDLRDATTLVALLMLSARG